MLLACGWMGRWRARRGRKSCNKNARRVAPLIRFLPVPEGVQEHIASKNVIPKPVLLPADSPLPFAHFAPGEFLDLVLPAAVVWITTKNGDQFCHRVRRWGTPPRDC